MGNDNMFIWEVYNYVIYSKVGQIIAKVLFNMNHELFCV